MIVAVLRVLHEDGSVSLSARVWSIVDRVLAYVFVPFLFIGFLLVPRYAYELVISVLCALLLARVVLVPATGGGSRLVRLLERRPIVVAGKASYSVFLWNVPVCVFLLLHGVALRGVSISCLLLDLAIVVPVVAGLSAITYLAIERPAMRLRGRTATRNVPRAVIAPVTRA